MTVVVRSTMIMCGQLLSPDSSYQLFGGGPLSETVGRRLVNEGVPLAVWYGGTEFGPPVRILDVVDKPEDPQQKTKDDWQYVEIEDMIKHRWVPEGDGQYELQILVRVALQNYQDCYTE